MRFTLLFAVAAALASSPLGAETGYSISAPGTVLAGYVTGDSLAVTVGVPADRHSERVLLRGRDKDGDDHGKRRD
jgi:hypothetical protein